MATRPAAEIHTAVPPLSAERQVTWPKRTRARLANGLEVVLAESHTIPKFHGELFLRAGNAPAVHRGPGREIEEALRRLGADLCSHGGADNSAIGFAGLSELAEPLLQLVNELAREAAFPEPEFERERRQKLEEVKLDRTQPGFLAGERLRKVLFGAHPYAQVEIGRAHV